MLQSVADVTCDGGGSGRKGDGVSRVVARVAGPGEAETGDRGVGSAARTESDVLERVGLIRLDADLQVGLGVAEGGLCVGRVGVESVERAERRGGGVDAPGRRTAESNNSNFRDVRGWRDERRRARTRRPFFVRDLQVRVLRRSAGNGICEAVEGGAGRGRGGGSVRSARRQFSPMGGCAGDADVLVAESVEGRGRTARPARDREYRESRDRPPRGSDRGEGRHLDASNQGSRRARRSSVCPMGARQQRRSAQTRKLKRLPGSKGVTMVW